MNNFICQTENLKSAASTVTVKKLDRLSDFDFLPIYNVQDGNFDGNLKKKKTLLEALFKHSGCFKENTNSVMFSI